MAFRSYPVKAVVNVHDGDTATFHYDMGQGTCHTDQLRFIGIFTKEIAEPGGTEARQFVVDWLSRFPAHGLTVYTALTAKGNERQTLGRWVGDVHDNETGESLVIAEALWLQANPNSIGGIGAK